MLVRVLNRFQLFCNGCDAKVPAGATYALVGKVNERRQVLLPGLYCEACADKHRRGTLTITRAPLVPAYSVDGKTWTPCDLHDSPG